MKRLKMAVLGMVFAVGMAGMVLAGSIDSPGAPGSAASKMPAFRDVYTYLTTGTPAPTPGTSFTEPTSGPASTGHTLTEIYAAVATPFPQCDAAASDVQSGKKFFCTVAGSWGLKTGTFVPQVYCTLLKTGQTVSYRAGDDASKNKGKAFSYTDSGNSVTDNVTGLMWAKSGTGAGCLGNSSVIWPSAIDWAVGLTFDGYSDWRLPNVIELQSICLRDAGQVAPYINTTYFSGTQSGYYWVSTTTPFNDDFAMMVGFNNGGVSSDTKTVFRYYVRAVRGGE